MFASKLRERQLVNHDRKCVGPLLQEQVSFKARQEMCLALRDSSRTPAPWETRSFETSRRPTGARTSSDDWDLGSWRMVNDGFVEHCLNAQARWKIGFDGRNPEPKAMIPEKKGSLCLCKNYIERLLERASK